MGRTSIRPLGKRDNRRRFSALLFAVIAIDGAVAFGAPKEPRVLIEGCKLELVAKEPEIVTPIGVAIDAKGRLLVVESHTHERPADYKGPAGDRVRMLSDSDGDGRLDKWSTFAEGYQQAMNLCVRPDGGVYLVTRRDVRLLRDTNDDGVSDQEQALLKLETEDQYPHNGLSGIAFVSSNAGGTLYLGLGENHGYQYELAGSDGQVIEDHGGAGSIFRCGENCQKIERYCSGFWNPFSLCYADGRLFCVDNDPDASPPCRLVEALPAGDYGHRYEYGRAGVHPLQAWNGELPGTLPMICGTGEAPTAVVQHRGYLWVTSWGDHTIERYELALGDDDMYRARKTIVVQGDADFRPTGMTVAPDGSLYFSDWVDRSYPVHGKGRIWRLDVGGAKTDLKQPATAGRLSAKEVLANAPHASESLQRPRDRQALIAAQAKHPDYECSDWNTPQDPLARVTLLEGLRWRRISGDDRDRTLREALADRDADVRLYALRWIADDRIMALRHDVAKLLDGPMPTERYFLAVLAALDWLDGDASMRSSGFSEELLIRELQNEKRSPSLHALALRLIDPQDKWLTLDRLKGYLASDSDVQRMEAVRTMAMRGGAGSWSALAGVAANQNEPSSLRADAIAGLAGSVGEHGKLLESLAQDNDSTVATEAARVLRLNRKRLEAAEQTPAVDDLAAWNKLLSAGGDAESGRRLFFMAAGPRCANCHQYGGRGERVGPDLTRIGRQQSRERVIASILQPSREIAPDYQPWTLVTADGVAHAGVRLPQGGDNGKENYADAEGKTFELISDEIELRQASDKSIMPDGLERMLTLGDLRDLVAFLCQSSE
jgi:putative membrane-bound dehydrogenase-like protein